MAQMLAESAGLNINTGSGPTLLRSLRELCINERSPPEEHFGGDKHGLKAFHKKITKALRLLEEKKDNSDFPFIFLNFPPTQMLGYLMRNHVQPSPGGLKHGQRSHLYPKLGFYDYRQIRRQSESRPNILQSSPSQSPPGGQGLSLGASHSR